MTETEKKIETLTGALEDAANNKDQLLEKQQELLKLKQNEIVGTPYRKVKRIKGEALLGRNIEEKHWPGERTHYEIDRDLILFNPAFVRLSRKAQVFIGQHNIFFKNRLMHTLEVVQFCRSVAQKRGLNVDLAEAIAYGHDIGHTPFGHAGEEVLNACLCEYYIRRALKLEKASPRGIGSDTSPTETEAGLDHFIWVIIHRITSLKRYEEDFYKELPKEELMKIAIGNDRLKLLKDMKIIRLQSEDHCDLEEPYKWMLDDKSKKELKTEFWIQEGQRKFFAHYIHSLRVLLCNYKKTWTDLTFRTAYGILCHSWTGPFTEFNCYIPSGKIFSTQELFNTDYETPEAFLVRTADDICFTNSDLEDGFKSGLLVWGDKGGSLNREEMLKIALLAGQDRAGDVRPQASERLRHCETGFDFSSPNREYCYKHSEEIREVRKIIKSKIYPLLERRLQTAKGVLRDLFWFYLLPSEEIDQKRPIEDSAIEAFEVYKKCYGDWQEKVSKPRSVADYIAKMTDEEAIGIHKALFAAEHAPWDKHFVKTSYT